MKELRSCEETQTHATIQLCMTGTYSTTLKGGVGGGGVTFYDVDIKMSFFFQYSMFDGKFKRS